MTPDQELIEQLRELNKRLAQFDVDFMHIKAHMESLENAIGNLTEQIRKK